jgi:hypothetical protein
MKMEGKKREMRGNEESSLENEVSEISIELEAISVKRNHAASPEQVILAGAVGDSVCRLCEAS